MKNKNAKISQCNFLSNKTIQSIIFIIGDVTFYKYLLESINHTLLQMSTEMRNIQECSNLKILHRYIILTNTILKNNIVLQKFSLLNFFFQIKMHLKYLQDLQFLKNHLPQVCVQKLCIGYRARTNDSDVREIIDSKAKIYCLYNVCQAIKS